MELVPKAFDTLLILVENRGRVVEKSELIKLLWPDSYVEEGNLTYYISVLRKALGESPDEHRYIVTAHRRGYSFVATVEEVRGKGGTTPEDEAKFIAPVALPLPARKPGFKLLAASVLSVILIAALYYVWVSNKSGRPAMTITGRSMAVVPFNVLNSADEQHLGLSMADALIMRLSNVEGITVRPTSSISSYSGRELDPRVIGKALGVDLILEGTVQRSHERVRVTVQLIAVMDGKPLWADRFDERAKNIFAAQDSISVQVAEALLLKMADAEKGRLVKRHTNNHEAHQAYLHGLYFWNKRTDEGLKKSIEYFRHAIEKDPGHAPAYAGLADAIALTIPPGADRTVRARAFEQAKAAAMKAIEIDEATAEAHATLALIKLNYEWDGKGAERAYERALELNPDYATGHQRYAWFLLAAGQVDRAIQKIQRAVELDPLSVANTAAFGGMLYYAGQYDESVEQCKKALELDPSFDSAQLMLGLAYEQKGMYEEAIAELQAVAERNSKDPIVMAALGHACAKARRRAEALKVIRQLKSLPEQNKVVTFGAALIHTGLGEKDRAFAWLRKAGPADTPSGYLLRLDPRFAPIREDSRCYGIVK